MECDFEIRLPNGSRVTLEVTSSTVSNRAQQVKLIERMWKCPGIQRNWSVSLDGAGHRKAGARINRFKSEAPPFFVTLEDQCPLGHGDLLNFGFSLELSPTAHEAISALNDLGARHGSLLDKPPYGSPHVALGWIYDNVAEDPSLNEVVGKLTQSNLMKLEKYANGERHLFIWIDQTDYRNYADLFTFQVPTESPVIPASVHRVWVGPWCPGINFDGSLQSLLSTHGTDPWVEHVGPKVADYYAHNEGKSTVKLEHLTNGVHPFGSAKPWRTAPIT